MAVSLYHVFFMSFNDDDVLSHEGSYPIDEEDRDNNPKAKATFYFPPLAVPDASVMDRSIALQCLISHNRSSPGVFSPTSLQLQPSQAVTRCTCPTQHAASQGEMAHHDVSSLTFPTSEYAFSASCPPRCAYSTFPPAISPRRIRSIMPARLLPS